MTPIFLRGFPGLTARYLDPKDVSGHRFVRGVFLLFALGALFLLLSSTPLETFLFDFLQRRFAGYRAPSGNAVLVTIDTESLEAAGERWPWPAKTFQRGIGQILAAEPEQIVLFLPFVSDRTNHPSRQAFQAWVQTQPRVTVCVPRDSAEWVATAGLAARAAAWAAGELAVAGAKHPTS